MPTIDGKYYKAAPGAADIETETTVTQKLGTSGKGYFKLTTRSTGRHKIEVHNGEQQQSNASYGYTDLDDTALLNLYNIIGAALGTPS